MSSGTYCSGGTVNARERERARSRWTVSSVVGSTVILYSEYWLFLLLLILFIPLLLFWANLKRVQPETVFPTSLLVAGLWRNTYYCYRNSIVRWNCVGWNASRDYCTVVPLLYHSLLPYRKEENCPAVSTLWHNLLAKKEIYYRLWL